MVGHFTQVLLYYNKIGVFHARIQEFLSGGVQVSLTKKALMFFF